MATTDYTDIPLEEMIEKAWKDYNAMNPPRIDFMPYPTNHPAKQFEIGERVILGGLENVHVVAKFEDDRLLAIKYDTHRRDETLLGNVMIVEWFDVVKFGSANKEEPELFSKWRPEYPSQSSIDNIAHQIANSGLLIDPSYQRGYVWTEEDQAALLDTIFDRMDINTVLYAYYKPYLFEKGTMKTFLTLDGREVEIDLSEDYFYAIIDGQQRITTIWRFMTNQFKYRGKYYSELNFSDRHAFKQHPLVHRTMTADEDEKNVLKLFLATNRGVPLNKEHVQHVIDRLND